MHLVTLNQTAPYTEGFFFSTLTAPSVRDAIVIRNPSNALCVSPVLLFSEKSLSEHIEHIRKNNIKKAIVIAENIEFLSQCPSLEFLRVIPSIYANEFDFSPLYSMPNLKWLNCETAYGENEEKFSCIDYSKINELKYLSASGKKGHLNTNCLSFLKTLHLYEMCCKSLKGIFNGSNLEHLRLCKTSINSLDGISCATQLKTLSLEYNKNLEDISEISSLHRSLIYLHIEGCGKIKDFSSLENMENIECLELMGSNTLPNLDFLNRMPNLKVLKLTMTVANGKIGICKKIPWVLIKNKNHYDYKDKDLSKLNVMCDYENLTEY